MSLASQEPPATAAPDTVRVAGEVVDVESARGVAGARVYLVPLAGEADIAPVDSDGVGRFAFFPVESGRYLLRIEHLGYRTLADTIQVATDGETRVRASMAPEAVDLEPMVVTVVRRTPAFMRDFERRRATGQGYFIDRGEIEERRPHVTSDLFRTVPAVRVVGRSAVAGPVLTMRGRCRPQLYIDGIAAGQQVSVDHMLRPGDIEAVEVYSTATAPPRYSRGRCGVILVWTRAPEPTMGDGSFWKRLAVLGGLFLGGFLLTR